ncbi:hypothetical protein [Halalkalicoccus sp. NIPERK01]|uniref:hypothetical protein n=1 Tax=Halalkalicoccus sp. NIPERK01 TaxID=3053469 RepID=UPI00256F65C5|nr:hypothetical protein [Halalkalicoccus sp. NIPERK01]MDL5361498.1 hypothetical protein [Halalkalicoccus sp. NIPERK01]
MWFPAHVAIGYVIGRKTALDTRWCVLGSIVPDLVDKTLGSLGVFPAYQTVSHSLLGLSVVAALLFGRYGPPTVGVAVGWTAHLAADVLQLFVNGRGDHAVAMLGWPVLHWENPMVVDPSAAYAEGLFASIPFVQEGYVRYYLALPAFYLELVILAYAVWLLAFDPAVTPALDGRGTNGEGAR